MGGAEYASLLSDLSKVLDCLPQLIMAILHADGFQRIKIYTQLFKRVKINTLREETFAEDIFTICDPFLQKRI